MSCILVSIIKFKGQFTWNKYVSNLTIQNQKSNSRISLLGKILSKKFEIYYVGKISIHLENNRMFSRSCFHHDMHDCFHFISPQLTSTSQPTGGKNVPRSTDASRFKGAL